METKKYRCDDELETLFLKQGLIETTTKRDRQKGKKEFRKAKNSSTSLRFDYINLVIYEHGFGVYGLEGSEIAEEDLKLFFWYFHSTTADKNYISDGHFNLDRTRQCVKTMTNLLRFSREFNRSTPESRKFERLLNNLTAINLN